MSRLLPDWIRAYMAYTAESESPDEYHQWVAISTISGALRRRSFFDFRYFLLYPNLYVVLVGPAGRCKKSTAMRIGRSMLAQVPGLSFTTDSTSRESLITDMTQAYVDGHSSMTAFSSEFASLLTTSEMTMITFLTDIYDCPNEWIHKTKGGGTNKIKGPFLNLQAAATPDWIARDMPLDTVGVGLTSRIIFVYQDTPRARKPFPELSDDQVTLGKLLVSDLQQISMVEGEFKFDDDAKKMYEEWYYKQLKDNESFDPRIAGYFARKPMHVIKVSMCISASRKDATLMTTSDLESAFAVLAHNEKRMTEVFSAVGKNPLTLDINQINAAIRAHPDGLGYDTILRSFKHNVRKDELAEILEVLRGMGDVRVDMRPEGPHYTAKDKDGQEGR